MRSIFKTLFLILVCAEFLQALGTQFLTVPVSARELTVLNTSWRNPALGYRAGSKPELGFSYGQWLADVRSFSLQYERNNTAIRLRYLGSEDLELRTNRPTDVPLEKYGAYGTALEGSYRWQWGKGQVGIGMKLVYFQIYTQSASGFGLDFGLRQALSKNMFITLSLLNIGRMNSFRNETPLLPRRIIAGVEGTFPLFGYQSSTIFTVENSSLVKGLILDAGNQFFYQNLIISNRLQQNGRIWSYRGGIGVRFGIYHLSYGFSTGNRSLGTPQILDISVRLP